MDVKTTVIEISTPQAFRSELGSLEVPLIRPRPAVLLVYGRQCPFGEKLKPLLEALAAGPYRERVAFYQMCHPIFRLFQPDIHVDQLPTLFFLDGHGAQKQMHGDHRDELKKGLDSLLFVPNRVFLEIVDSQYP